jgi:RimJ/RimL family protein N-acetyltransferase
VITPLPEGFLLERQAPGEQIGAILDRAAAEADFWTLPAAYADQQAKDNISKSRVYVSDTSIDGLAEYFSQWAGMPIVNPLSQVPLLTTDGGKFGLVVLHNATANGDAEMVAAGSPRIWNRTVIRALARWIFLQNELRRVTVRVRGSQLKTREYAVRLGFKFEGVQRRYFSDDEDAYCFGMLRRECRWLKGH